MSAKWRAMQHRHRYTYNSVLFPKRYAETLNLVPTETFSSFDFFPKLKDFISLNTTYSQISAVKDLSSSFTRLLNSTCIQEATISTAVRLYLEILFLENSLPLHRTLISALTKNNKFLPVITSCFAALCNEYADVNRMKRFLVSRVALSLMGYPKLGFLNEMVQNCAVLVASDVALGLARVILDIDYGSRPSPLVMEQCQDAMSCLYYLLQKFPNSLSALEEGFCTFEKIIGVLLSVLKSSAFSRDCLVAAGVSFCAGIQARVRAEDVSYFISKAVFGFSGENRDVMGLGENLSLDLMGLSFLSRICLLRGILTAISRPVLNTYIKLADGSMWTILYNAILPELCKYCENPIDSHFNFHALTVLQICLQQIKTSILTDLTDVLGDYDPLPVEMMSRLLRVVWNNLEDPLSQTVKQVHLIFDLLLDIKSSLPLNNYNEKNRPFLRRIALDLLQLGSRCKGKYVPLASLAKRLGSKSLLSLNQNLLFETIYAYADDDICCAATSFLKCFLECLRDECWTHDGIEKGYDTFRKLCLPPLMNGLLSGHSKLRTNLNTYALPALLDVDSDSIFPMLSFISVGHCLDDGKCVDPKVDSCIAALVSLLKVSRALALIDGDIDLDTDSLSEPCSSGSFALVCLKGTDIKVLVDWLIMALTHADESLRIDAAESLFFNPKTASLPSSLELSLMRQSVPLNMRCSSTAFQMKWTSLFRKFFSRVRTALERQMKQGLWLPVTCNGVGYTCTADFASSSVIHRAEELFQFMKWLSSYLFHSCYPSAPYERKTMAMELILTMMDVWPPNMLQGNQNLYPYSEGFTSADSTLSLVGSIIDSWDRLRENSFRILLCFPTPLPGISSHDTVNMAITWAKRLVCSARVRESDAGALTFRLIFRKYVMELGWMIGTSLSVAHIDPHADHVNGGLISVSCKAPLVAYISALIDWLRISVEEGERDLSEACRNSFVHGILLTLRYTFEELDWSSKAVTCHRTEIRCLLKTLFELVIRVTSLALWVVSADTWYMPYDMDDAIDDANFLSDSISGMDSVESSLEQVYTVKNFDDIGKPAEHVVMVGCWLAIKEVSLLLGTIIRKAPLPSCISLESSKHVYPHSDGGETEKLAIDDGMLDLQQLESIGSHFLQILLKMKHNGAIDKTRAGFTALCNRLLCSNDPRLCKMTETWMEQLMERTMANGQTVDDLLRRSAGIPAAFIAFFLSEPEGTPKMLLPRALTWLINVAKGSLCENCEDSSLKNEVPHQSLINQNEENGSASKMRDKGVIPTVHSFNVLRASFNDTNLAADTSGFCAEALVVAIRSFSSPYWEVRNSACLAYTALVRRMIGFLNVHKRESARRALTGLEFFHRYPALHPFLSSELEIATKLLGDGYSMGSYLSISNAIHPSLCPILILLSRLRPSLISSNADDNLDPFMLMPYIRRCGAQSNLRVRVLAARALIGLVSNEKLQVVLTEVTHGLPRERLQMASPTFSFNSMHGILLQLSSLLENNCRNLADVVKKDDILGELMHALLGCSWIGSISSCPCPMLTSSYLLVLDQMLGIAMSNSSKHIGAIRTLLMKLAFECMNADNAFCAALFDPTMVELRMQAAGSYFNCLFGGKQEASDKFYELQNFGKPTSFLDKMPANLIPISELQDRIVSCISDSMYEVRIITLKKLFQLASSITSDGDDGERSTMYIFMKTHLPSALMQLLAKEENPKCIYYILKIIFSCSAFQSNEFTDSDKAFCFWDTLVHLKNTVTRAKTREIILCCMAICTKKFVKMLQGFISGNQPHLEEDITKAFKCIECFVILTKQHSAPSEHVNMRRATAEAIIASGLLEEANFVALHVSNSCIQFEEAIEIEGVSVDMPEFVNLYARRVLDLWFICIQLIEDEDVVLRQNLANDVQKYIDFRDSGVSRQVDQVIELSLAFLSKIFRHWLVFLEYLLSYVWMVASSVSFHANLVRKIFEKEIDNHHEEKLLICQVCCFHLEELLAGGFEGLENKRGELVQRCRLRSLRQLVSLANSFPVSEGDRDWIGGIGNHKDAFTSLYATLLSLYVLAQSSQNLTDLDEMYLLEFSMFKSIMRPFLGNPQISNLYHLLIRLHERIGISCGSEPWETIGGSSNWEEFDPYFLLR